MGLSVMADMPDMDQQMRFANVSGRMQEITPHQWVGESTMHGLGFEGTDAAGNVVSGPGYDPNQVNPNVNAVLGFASGIFNTIQQNKANKKNKNAQRQPQVQPSSMVSHEDAGSGGGMDMSKLLIYGGIAVVGVVVLMMVLKKKKNAGGE